MRIFSFLVVITIVLSACGESEKVNKGPYDLSEAEITSKKSIERLTVAQIDVSEISPEGIPVRFREHARFCCEVKPNSSAKKRIDLKSENEAYRWFLCNLNTRFAEDDSLKNLSIKEKLAIVDVGEVKYLDKLPFDLNSGEWFQVFGLADVDGAYYVRMDENEGFVVKYYEGGL